MNWIELNVSWVRQVCWHDGNSVPVIGQQLIMELDPSAERNSWSIDEWNIWLRAAKTVELLLYLLADSWQMWCRHLIWWAPQPPRLWRSDVSCALWPRYIYNIILRVNDIRQLGTDVSVSVVRQRTLLPEFPLSEPFSCHLSPSPTQVPQFKF